MGGKQVYLASKSPRRQQLLGQILSDFATISVEIDETPRVGEDPKQYVCRLALEKAAAGLLQVPKHAFVLGGDTVIEFQGKIIGKPESSQHAKEILQMLSGQQHQVLSSIALLSEGFEGVKLSVNQVTFASLPDEWINRYVASEEPLDKAGAYAIQGQAGSWVKEIQGSYSAIVGLPLYETRELLAQAGIIDF